MSKTLVIVESPGKIKKIQQILGSNYIITASVGHIIDLASNKLSIDVDNGFNPIYSPIDRAVKIIKDIKSLLKKCSDVLLATDKDREGEMIAWSLAYILQLKNPKRIIFTSVTKEELMKAIKNPKLIDQHMVDAQKTRRILDRLVGFKLSPIVKQQINGDSAGRVQSVFVKLIVDKENEINKFINGDNASYFRFKGNFDLNGNTINSNLYSTNNTNGGEDSEESNNDTDNEKSGIVKFNEKNARKFFEGCLNSDFKISSIENTKSSSNPSPPYETSTLQQEASSYLKFTSKRTMMAAQHLYEEGHITYMRTDSISLSKDAMENVKKYVLEIFGIKYYSKREYKTKSSDAQEAHEAIRPTDMFLIPEKLDIGGKISEDEQKLYKLIWRRTIASQMSAAQYDVYNLKISVSEYDDYYFLTIIRKLIFDGYLKIYGVVDDDNIDNILGSLKKQDLLKVNNITSTEEYPKPKPRYSEASLIKTLKKLKIGRPATTATIISKIQDRKYVMVKNIDGIKKDILSMTWDGESDNILEEKSSVLLGQEKNKFVPTKLGKLSTEFLNNNFTELMDYKFTTDMEKKLDKIEQGKLVWNNELKIFYDKFNPLVQKLAKETKVFNDRPTRILGKHPETGHELIATISKYGDVVKYSISEKETKYASIEEPLTMDTISLEQAIELFKFPMELGIYDGNPVIVKKGMYGLYISFSGKNFPVQNEQITLNDAIDMIKTKQKNILKELKDSTYTYTILNGQYGMYLSAVNNKTKKSRNIGLSKKIGLDDVDLDYIQLMMESEKSNKKGKNMDKSITESITKPVDKPDIKKKPSPKKKPETSVKKTSTKKTPSKTTRKKKPDSEYAF